MKVLFIADKHQGIMPQGIMYLSAVLNVHGFDVHYSDGVDYVKLEQDVSTLLPDLLAYSCTSGKYNYYNQLNLKLKKYNIMSVLGGPHATFFGKEFMVDDSISFDGACVGEGEFALLDLCRKLRDGLEYSHLANWIFRKPFVINNVRPLISNLDELPFPDFKLDRSALEKKKVIFWLHRGCVFDCTYCMNHKWREIYKGLGEVIRVPSVNYCIELIKFRLSLNEVNVENILFQDDIFGVDMEWLELFCEMYKKKIGLPWDAHLNPTLITEKRISLMAAANCKTIETAIEAGNEKIRRELLKRPMTNAQIKKGADIVRSYGMSLRIQNILLLPGETLRTAFQTFNLNVQCKPEIATASKFQPYPGLELTERAIEMGYIKRGGFEANIPDNFHWVSILEFPDKKEKERISNLLNLFTFGTYFTFLKPLIYLLIKLPSNKLYYHIDNVAWKTITHRKDKDMIRRPGLKLKIFVKFIYNFFLPSNIRYTANMNICRDRILN